MIRSELTEDQREVIDALIATLYMCGISATDLEHLRDRYTNNKPPKDNGQLPFFEQEPTDATLP